MYIFTSNYKFLIFSLSIFHEDFFPSILNTIHCRYYTRAARMQAALLQTLFSAIPLLFHLRYTLRTKQQMLQTILSG